jgi:putative SOS response-associated peptidase YedK
VTTSAAPSTVKYHDRMPVILEENQFDDWMRSPPELAADMMKPTAGQSKYGRLALMSATFATTVRTYGS